MILKLSVLFFTPLLSGLISYLIPFSKKSSFRLLLVFAGSYLFAITVVHILPELYRDNEETELIGFFVLAGFFLQHLLEYFSSGIEHGHVHDRSHHAHGDPEQSISAFVLLLALCIHAFLEGGMLAQPSAGMNMRYDINAILIGIALHRAPAAFALMTVLNAQLRSPKKSLPYLIIFSLAAPLGLMISTYFVESEIISSSGLVYLYAIVSGNFLHISTTIVFENSPDHRFNPKKLIVAMIGAITAVAVEYII